MYLREQSGNALTDLADVTGNRFEKAALLNFLGLLEEYVTVATLVTAVYHGAVRMERRHLIMI